MVRACFSDNTQTHGYVPNSVYRTRTQYRTQRYPTFSLHGHKSRETDSLARSSGSQCCSGIYCKDEKPSTHQANAHDLSAATSISDGGFNVCDGVALAPCALSSCGDVASSDGRTQFLNAESQYISSCYSHMSTSLLVSDSHNLNATGQTFSSNFYSTSSQYSMRSKLYGNPVVADRHHIPIRTAACGAVMSHASTSVQQRQNVIQISKPFESSDVLRFSEKLRRQRLNCPAIAPTEFL